MERDADGDSRALTRRRLLGGVVAATGSSVGCLGGPTAGSERTPTTETATARETTAPTTGTENGEASAAGPRVASVSVSDFIEYPLAGVHPHVHNRANIQYVVVGIEPSSTDAEPDAIRERLGLALDGHSMELAIEQPFEWRQQTVDVAFAVPKDEPFDGGSVQFGGARLTSLSTATLDRLNNPPVFAVSDLRVVPDELGVGERTTATVQFRVSNTGEGRGTFGASVQGNYASGSATVTVTLDAGETRETVVDVEVVGRDEAVNVTFDSGVTVRRLTIPVVRPSTTAAGKTETGTATPN